MFPEISAARGLAIAQATEAMLRSLGGHLVATLGCYADARACAADAEAFLRALARHWATDPQYAEKVLAIYRRSGLMRLDQEALSY